MILIIIAQDAYLQQQQLYLSCCFMSIQTTIHKSADETSIITCLKENTTMGPLFPLKITPQNLDNRASQLSELGFINGL